MGGERASAVRMRLPGQICALCRARLPEPHTPGEQLCASCKAPRTKLHRVYMSFMLREGWYCQFLEEDLKTPLPRKVTLKTVDQIKEIARRGGASLNLESRQALEHAIENGRGGIYLQLTEEQYRKLK